MRRIAILLALFIALTSSADISIPPGISIPAVPPTMPVFTTVQDSGLKTAMEDELKTTAVREVLGGLSVFLPLAADGPGVSAVDTETAVAQAFFNVVLPSDGTARKVEPRFVVTSVKFKKNTTPGVPDEPYAIVRMNRFVNVSGTEYRVYGEGSSAVVEVQNKLVRASIIRWERVNGSTPADTITWTSRTLLEELKKSFHLLEGYDVVVLASPDIVYYDDRSSLRPALRVRVSIDRHDGASHSDQEDIFVPLTGAPVATVLLPGDQPGGCALGAAQITNDISVDRYALSGENKAWYKNAQRFQATLSGGPFVARRFCVLAPIMLDADPGYIDGANVALIEAHGEAGCVQFATCAALETAHGYGGTNDGLQLLILHSCRIIATRDDDPNGWTARWWTIFKGLHTVLGFRTRIDIKDDVAVRFAAHLGAKNPMIRSWIDEAVNWPGYKKDARDGRAAAITVCDHDRDTVAELARISSPDCLIAYWVQN